ncbi:hypothetical protein TNCV_1176581 [Trichonephila clavipes]|nr:hypothetical protein TNCV_1176581 [Trichonephila clavipes]
MTPELAPPLLTTTPHQQEDVSALDRFSVHRCPTREVFSGTGLELETSQPRSDTLTTRLPWPHLTMWNKSHRSNGRKLRTTFIRGKPIRRTQENDAKGKIWETLLHNRKLMNLSKQIFYASFRTLTGYGYLKGHLHCIGVKNTPD